MVVVRSVSTVRSTPAGIAARSVGMSALMRSTVSTTLAPGWRWTFMISARVEFIQPPSLAFSAPATSVATSRKRTGAPFL